MSLWLIGFRAAGKTTLGRLFAEKNGWRFLDLDEELERRLGETILSFAGREGMAAFRVRERELLREVCAVESERVVIATGGGFVDDDESREIVRASRWPKAWLDPPAEALWERLRDAPDRRKIGHLTDPEAMLALLEKRRPFYEKIATFRVPSQDIEESLASLQCLVSGGN